MEGFPQAVMTRITTIKSKVFYCFEVEHLTDGNGMNPPTTIVVRPPFDKGGKGTGLSQTPNYRLYAFVNFNIKRAISHEIALQRVEKVN